VRTRKRHTSRNKARRRKQRKKRLNNKGGDVNDSALNNFGVYDKLQQKQKNKRILKTHHNTARENKDKQEKQIQRCEKEEKMIVASTRIYVLPYSNNQFKLTKQT